MSASRPALWEVINLVDLHLVRLDARTAFPPDALPEDPPLVHLRYRGRGRDRPTEGLVEVTTEFRLWLTREGDDAELLSVAAEFRALYVRPEEHVPTADEVDEFARRNGVFNAWPFWRELAHNTLLRMGIPVPLIPVFRVETGIHDSEE